MDLDPDELRGGCEDCGYNFEVIDGDLMCGCDWKDEEE
jgi:hypothetical protein